MMSAYKEKVVSVGGSLYRTIGIMVHQDLQLEYRAHNSFFSPNNKQFLFYCTPFMSKRSHTSTNSQPCLNYHWMLIMHNALTTYDNQFNLTKFIYP